MLSRLFQYFRYDLALDLGTANTLVGVVGEGIVVDEPSVVAVEQGTRRVLCGGSAVGHLARQMEGRTPESIAVVRPLGDGVVADFQLCEAMLRNFLRKAQPPGWRLKPRVLVGVPGRITPVEKRAVFNSVQRAGARQVWLHLRGQGGRHRRRAAHRRAAGQHGLRHRRRIDRNRRPQPRRNRSQPVHPRRRRPHGPGHRRLSPPPLQPAHRAARRRTAADRDRQRLSPGRRTGRGGQAAWTPSAACREKRPSPARKSARPWPIRCWRLSRPSRPSWTIAARSWPPI